MTTFNRSDVVSFLKSNRGATPAQVYNGAYTSAPPAQNENELEYVENSHYPFRLPPSYSIDLTTGVLPSGWTYDRPGNATVLGADGYFDVVGADTARWCRCNNTLAIKGLLIEEGRTNYITYGDTPASWGVSGITSAASSDDDIYGGSAAYLFTETTATSAHYIDWSTYAYSGNQTWTWSVFVRPRGISRTLIVLLANGSSIDNNIQLRIQVETGEFNLTQAGNGVVYEGYCVKYGNGWYRIGVTGLPSATATSIRPRLYYQTSITNTYNSSYTGSTSAQFDVFGSQLELGFGMTTYIPTNGSAQTRSRDKLAQASGVDWWPEEGTLLVKAEAMTIDATGLTLASTLFSVDGGTYENAFYHGTNTVSGTPSSVLNIVNNSPTSTIYQAVPIDSVGLITAVSFANTDTQHATNGVASDVAADSPQPSVYRAAIGRRSWNYQRGWNGNISHIDVYTYKFTEDELIGATER